MSPERMRIVVSTVLLVGVLISASLIAIGFAGSFIVGWEGSLSGQPVAAPSGTADFNATIAGLLALRPQAISQLGLLVMIATPIVRVATSLFGFATEGDRLYVAITGGVLAILIMSALFIR